LECAKYYWHGELCRDNGKEGRVFEYLRSQGYGVLGRSPDFLTRKVEGLLAKRSGYGEYVLRLERHIRQKSEKAKSMEGTGLFLSRLENLPELKALNNRLGQAPELSRDLSALCRNDLTGAYLKRRACDIARYGRGYADLSFPQPPVKGASQSSIEDIVGRLVRLIEAPGVEEEKRRQETRLNDAAQEIQRTILSVPVVPQLLNALESSTSSNRVNCCL
jgi:hypothetical protein